MAKNIYVGNNETASKVKKIYVGVDGVAREVQKAYVGVNGIARLCWQRQDTWQRYSVINKTSYSIVTAPWSGETSSSSTFFERFMANAAGSTGRREFYLSVGTGYNFDETTGLFTLQNTKETISESQTVSNSSYFLYVIGSQHGVQPSENSSTIYLLSNINSTVEIGYQYRGSAGNVSNTRFGTNERNRGSLSSLTVYTSNSETYQERGDYIDTVEADPGTYPDDGIQGDYWYVKVE